jgi:hypothetical protein
LKKIKCYEAKQYILDCQARDVPIHLHYIKFLKHKNRYFYEGGADMSPEEVDNLDLGNVVELYDYDALLEDEYED